MRLIQIENHSRDQGTFAVAGDAHPPHSIRIDRNAAVAGVTGGIRKIEQEAIRVNSSFVGGLNRGAESNFYTQIGAVPDRRDMLQRCCRAGLCRGTRQQQHHGPQMFLYCLHACLTFGGVSFAT